MLYEFSLKTGRTTFHDITSRVEKSVAESKIKDGICIVYCPHTTAGITINENADPDVVKDMVSGFEAAFPDSPDFSHLEGNSDAHLKSSCTGCSETLIINNGTLLRGTWQGIYFCEFDGPRTRKYYVKVMGK